MCVHLQPLKHSWSHKRKAKKDESQRGERRMSRVNSMQNRVVKTSETRRATGETHHGSWQPERCLQLVAWRPTHLP